MLLYCTNTSTIPNPNVASLGKNVKPIIVLAMKVGTSCHPTPNVVVIGAAIEATFPYVLVEITSIISN
jgi:hypothetical protein